jgi:6-phosphogluconolactonase
MDAPYRGFVGTFTDGASDGVYGCHVDADGVLERGSVTECDDPTFLTFGADGETLYAASNVDDGAVTAFAVDDETWSLSPLNTAPVGDAGPCFVSVDATGSVLLTAQYHGGSVSSLPIADDGRVEEPSAVVEHEGSSVNPNRQTEPHPHSIVPGPANDYAYAADLGTDEVVVYDLDAENASIRPSDVGAVDVHDGAGPRHLAFHPDGDVAYLVNELDSTLVAFERDPASGDLDPVATVDTIPGSFEGDNYPADVHVHPDGDVLYSSNRGQDTIATFSIDDPRDPELVDTVSTQGEWPRHFQLTPDARYLVVENEDTDDVRSYEIDADGRLSATGHEIEIPDPVCLRFRDG